MQSYSKYIDKQNAASLVKLKKFIKERNITRAQLIVFLRRHGFRPTASHTDEDLINQINKQSNLFYVVDVLPKIKAAVKGKSLKALTQFINEKNITRAQLIAFLNKEKKTVLTKESTDDIINRIYRNYKFDYITETLPNIKAKIREKRNDVTTYSKVYGFKKNASTYKIHPTETNKKSFDKFISDTMIPNIEIILKSLNELKNIKSYNVLKAIMLKKNVNQDGEVKFNRVTVSFTSDVYTVENHLNLQQKINKSNSKIILEVDMFLRNGSGYIFGEALGMFVNIVL